MKINVDDKIVELSDEQVALFDALTRLQQGVVTGHLQGMSPADAHRYAKGTCKNEENRTRLAGEILRNPSVVKFLDTMQNAQQQRLAEAVMSRDEVALRLSEIARTNIDDVLTLTNKNLFDETGEIVQQGSWSFKDPGEMRGAGTSMISELTVGKQGVKVKLHSQVDAMKQLSTLMGYDKPTQLELSGGVDVTVRSKAEMFKDLYGED